MAAKRKGNASSKLPAIQFYPGDWRKDVGVQSLSYHDRGVWFEILLLMHESERRGVLTLNGKPMPEAALARVLGLDNQILTTTITTLLEHGVTSREPNTQALICRRMVRDEQLRVVRKECGKLGGNPNLLKKNNPQGDKNLVNQKSTPSSSSSSSNTKHRRSIAPIFVLPDWIDRDAWEGYEEMRASIRKKPTDRARALIVGKLDAMRKNGRDPADILRRSTMSNWTDVYEPNNGQRAALAPPAIKYADPEVMNAR